MTGRYLPSHGHFDSGEVILWLNQVRRSQLSGVRRPTLTTETAPSAAASPLPSGGHRVPAPTKRAAAAPALLRSLPGPAPAPAGYPPAHPCRLATSRKIPDRSPG